MAVKKYEPVQMDIGSGRKVLIGVREDVITYFGMPATTVGDVVVQRTRKAYTRSQYDGLNDTTATSVQVARSEWQSVKRIQSRGAGIPVKVPTEKTTGTNQNIRFVTIRFPQNAVIGAISEFLHSKCTLNKPAYFIMPSGARYPVVNVPGDVNAGETNTTGDTGDTGGTTT